MRQSGTSVIYDGVEFIGSKLLGEGGGRRFDRGFVGNILQIIKLIVELCCVGK